MISRNEQATNYQNLHKAKQCLFSPEHVVLDGIGTEYHDDEQLVRANQVTCYEEYIMLVEVHVAVLMRRCAKMLCTQCTQ